MDDPVFEDLQSNSASAEAGSEGVTQMAALRAHRQGGPEVLVVERVPAPNALAGEILVAVHACAITFDELKWPQTWTRDGVSRTPVILAHEVSGVVSHVGSGVAEFEPGDEVFGIVGLENDGAAADFVAVAASGLAPRPTSLPHLVTAALPMAGLTALQALVDHAGVQAGEKVLIHGGAGGVGAMTVQLAAILRAQVTTTVRSDDYALIRSFGADRVIDVRTEAFDEDDAVYDVVIDTVGGETLDRSFGVLRRGGRLITIAGNPPAGKADEYGITATFFVFTPNRGQLEELAALVEGGRLNVAIAETFPLDRGREAFESGQRQQRRAGKTVIVVREGQ
jgi:NADPH:quinone reductase-like Zn-dependent oxidoreductase